LKGTKQDLGFLKLFAGPDHVASANISADMNAHGPGGVCGTTPRRRVRQGFELMRFIFLKKN
jgi:hypothetical protein